MTVLTPSAVLAATLRMYGLLSSRVGKFENVMDPDEPEIYAVAVSTCLYIYFVITKTLTVLTRKVTQSAEHANHGSTGLDISRNVVSFNPWTVVNEIQLKCCSCMHRETPQNSDVHAQAILHLWYINTIIHNLDHYNTPYYV